MMPPKPSKTITEFSTASWTAKPIMVSTWNTVSSSRLKKPAIGPEARVRSWDWSCSCCRVMTFNFSFTPPTEITSPSCSAQMLTRSPLT